MFKQKGPSMTKEEHDAYIEKQMKKPTMQWFSMFPDFEDTLYKWNNEKLRPLEEPNERIARQEKKCDVQKFARYMCMRNMSSRKAVAECWRENEDLAECEAGSKRVARNLLLKKGSAMVGDVVPGLYGNTGWRY